MRTKPTNALLLSAGLAMATLGERVAVAANAFTLTSTTFRDGRSCPRKSATTRPATPPASATMYPRNCPGPASRRGPTVSPLVVIDSEGANGAGYTHLIAYGIPSGVTSFAEGEASLTADKFVAGKSDKGVPTFAGPCPPPGSPHHYIFLLIATDLDRSALAPGLTLAELQAKLRGHRKGAAGLVGTYVNPYPR